jgi:hypothetical protein
MFVGFVGTCMQVLCGFQAEVKYNKTGFKRTSYLHVIHNFGII